MKLHDAVEAQLLVLDIGTSCWWVVIFPLQPFTSRRRSPGIQQLEAWSPPEKIWMLWRREKSFTRVGN